MHWASVVHSREKYFTIGNDNKKKKFGLRTHRQILHISTEQEPEHHTPQKESIVEGAIQEAEFGPKLSHTQQQTLKDMIHEYKDQFGLGVSPLGRINKHPVTVTLTMDKPYPPILKKSPYPASPRARVEIQKHLDELLNLGVIRKVGEDEEVGITTPVIIAWHNGKSRLCGDFRPLNTYTVPDRYPLPRIQHALQKLSKAVYITTMDVMKGFHQNLVAEGSRRFLRIIYYLGIYEYLRMHFGIKNAPAFFQRMMDLEFSEALREGWLQVYIDDLVIYHDNWEDHIKAVKQILDKCKEINMTISIKKCRFGFHEVKALCHIVSGLWIAVDQNKIAAVMDKPIPAHPLQ